MNENNYTFRWNLTPSVSVEYTIRILPFEAIARHNGLTLTAGASAADEQGLLQQADQLAHDLVRCLSYELGQRFEITYSGYERQTPDGRRDAIAVLVGGVISMSASADFELRDTAGNVVDSSEMQRARKRQATQHRLSDLTRRAALDANLRDMLDHWSRYTSDPDGRLHPLYDVLQVAERLSTGLREKRKSRKNRRQKVAADLNMSSADLDELGDLTNDPALLKGRHPGESLGPHRIATDAEVNICERVARAIIANYAAKIVV